MQIHRRRMTGWELSLFVKVLQQTFVLWSYVAIGFLKLSRAAKVLGCSYLGIHDQLEVPSTCQEVLKTLRLAIAGGKKVEGKKVGRVYCHCSLPCTGGSPLLNFSDASIRERHQAKFFGTT